MEYGISLSIVVKHDNYAVNQTPEMLQCQEKVQEVIDQTIIDFTTEHAEILDNGEKGTPVIQMDTKTIFKLNNPRAVTESSIQLRIKRDKRNRNYVAEKFDIKSLTRKITL
jgi:hypothetical protein